MVSTKPLLKGFTTERLNSTIYHIAWSSDHRYLATGDNNKQILIWQIDPDNENNFSDDEYQPAKMLDLLEKGFHQGYVQALAWSPDGKRLASGGSDDLVLIWDIDFDLQVHQSPTIILESHTDWVTSLIWIAESRLISGSRDSEIIVWNPETGDPINKFSNENHAITCMAISPCLSYLAVGSEDGIVRIYNWVNEKLYHRLSGHEGCINSLAWSSNNILASASSDKTIRLWDVLDLPNSQNYQSKVLIGHAKRALAVSFSPDGKLLASQSQDMTLRFWDVELGKPVDFKEWECSSHPNTGMSFDKNIPILVSLGKKDHVFRVWKVSVETMLNMSRKRSSKDNEEWNRLEQSLIRTKSVDVDNDVHEVTYAAVEEAGFLPVFEETKSFQEFYKLAKESDFLVRVYLDVNDLYGYHEEINAFLNDDKECYLFIADKIYQQKDYENLVNDLHESANNQSSISKFSDIDDLKEKIVLSLKKRFSSKREVIDVRTSLQNRETNADFVIFSAIERECIALCSTFDVSPADRIHKDNRTYWHKQLKLPNNQYYEIIITQFPDMANVNSALAANEAFNHWHPQASLMVGIAAAVSSNYKLGDIILGKNIYYFERGKVTADGSLPAPIMYSPDATLWDRVIHTPKTDFHIHADRPDGTDRSPDIYPGVIACGEKVIDDAEFRDSLITKHRGIAAIEMEGYGVSAAAWQRYKPVRSLVIRSLCDYADGQKNDTWHEYAAAAAAGFAKHFLLDMPLPPRNQ